MTFSYPGWRNGFDPAVWRRVWLKTSKAPTILVVDDDAIVAEIMTALVAFLKPAAPPHGKA